MAALLDILQVLPRTQCQQCGCAGCEPFAAALLDSRARVDACKPGGAPVRQRLARTLGSEMPTVTPAEVRAPWPTTASARIVDDACIGCAKCLDACPVDAIIGAPHQLHVVIADHCTGCELCIPPCPVDCIVMDEARTEVPVRDLEAMSRIATTPHTACTACGECDPKCPHGLSARHLLADVLNLDFAAAAQHRISACTACGECEKPCSSRIPLAAYFRHGQTLMAEEQARATRASLAALRAQRKQARPPRPAAETLLADIDSLTPDAAGLEIGAAITRASLRRGGQV